MTCAAAAAAAAASSASSVATAAAAAASTAFVCKRVVKRFSGLHTKARIALYLSLIAAKHHVVPVGYACWCGTQALSNAVATSHKPGPKGSKCITIAVGR
jgi:hypothetical protein